MARKRITISLESDSPSDKAVLEFLTVLRRRTRSEIVKEILFDALEKTNDRTVSTPEKPASASGTQAMDPDELIAKLF